MNRTSHSTLVRTSHRTWNRTSHRTTHITTFRTICAKASSPRRKIGRSKWIWQTTGSARLGYALRFVAIEHLRHGLDKAVNLRVRVVEVRRHAGQRTVRALDDGDFDAALPEALAELVPGQAEVWQPEGGQ